MHILTTIRWLCDIEAGISKIIGSVPRREKIGYISGPLQFVLLESVASLLFIKVIKASWHLISTAYQIIFLTKLRLRFTMARFNHFQNRIIKKW